MRSYLGVITLLVAEDAGSDILLDSPADSPLVVLALALFLISSGLITSIVSPAPSPVLNISGSLIRSYNG